MTPDDLDHAFLKPYRALEKSHVQVSANRAGAIREGIDVVVPGSKIGSWPHLLVDVIRNAFPENHAEATPLNDEVVRYKVGTFSFMVWTREGGIGANTGQKSVKILNVFVRPVAA